MKCIGKGRHKNMHRWWRVEQKRHRQCKREPVETASMTFDLEFPPRTFDSHMVHTSSVDVLNFSSKSKVEKS